MEKITIDIISDEWDGKPTLEPVVNKDGYFAMQGIKDISVGDLVEIFFYADEGGYVWPSYYTGVKTTNRSEVVKIIDIQQHTFDETEEMNRLIQNIESTKPYLNTLNGLYGGSFYIKVKFLSEMRDENIDTLLN
jgi:hypothetical protein